MKAKRVELQSNKRFLNTNLPIPDEVCILQAEIEELEEELADMQTKKSKSKRDNTAKLDKTLLTLRGQLNNDALFACVFYDMIFDGRSKLRPSHPLPSRPPDRPIILVISHFIDTICQGKTKCVLPIEGRGLTTEVTKIGGKSICDKTLNIATPFNTLSTLIKLLSGRDLSPSAIRSRYRRTKSVSKPKLN